MGFTVHLVIMDRCVKGRFHLTGRAAENQGAAAGLNLFELESLTSQPCRDLVQIGVRGSETAAIIFRTDPLVIARGNRILLVRYQLVQFGLLGAIASENQNHPAHLQVRGDRAAIELRPSQRMHVPPQPDRIPVVDGVGNPVLGLRLGGQGHRRETRHQSKSNRYKAFECHDRHSIGVFGIALGEIFT